MRKSRKSAIRYRPNGKTRPLASKGVSTTARIDAQIEQAKARLSALYAKRRAIIAASKPPKRMSAAETGKQIVALALAGADMPTIMAKVQRSSATIRYRLWQSIADELSEAEDYAKELELKQQRYPGIKWRMVSDSGVRSYLPPWPLQTHPANWRTMRIVLNDGSVDPPDDKPA